MELPEIPAEQHTPLVDSLLGLFGNDRNQQLEEVIQQLRDEIAFLKGQKLRPQISPSRLESSTPRPALESPKRPGSEKRAKTRIRCTDESQGPSMVTTARLGSSP